MTALQLSNFITLEALDRVIGITSSRFLFNKEMKQRLKEGTTKKIGMEGNFDAEVIIQANPDLILISPFKRGGYDSLKELGIPLLPHLGYKEMTPLGQAEWIKCMGLLVGLESEAIARSKPSKNVTTNCCSLPPALKSVRSCSAANYGAVTGMPWAAKVSLPSCSAMREPTTS
jgi:hypothetical protein